MLGENGENLKLGLFRGFLPFFALLVTAELTTRQMVILGGQKLLQ